MSKDKQEVKLAITSMLKDLEAVRERTEQVEDVVSWLRFYTRTIGESAQRALIIGDTDSLVRDLPLPGFIETDANLLRELAKDIEAGADLLDMHFYYLSGEGEDEEDEE